METTNKAGRETDESPVGEPTDERPLSTAKEIEGWFSAAFDWLTRVKAILIRGQGVEEGTPEHEAILNEMRAMYDETDADESDAREGLIIILDTIELARRHARRKAMEKAGIGAVIDDFIENLRSKTGVGAVVITVAPDKDGGDPPPPADPLAE